ncbi:MAG TPA: glycosylase, partial [Planctomycetota bacterium]|nr:glycosylase [Planctomycetota bacterium]
MLRRLFSKLLLDPSDVEPTRADLEVVSAFNPGVILDPRTNETIFLVRIAERPRDALADPVSLPRWVDGEIVIDLVPQSDVEIIDPRVVRIRSTGTLRLTFASHVRVYRSRDGKEIDPSRHQTFAPEGELETFGVEDPRITHLEGRFWITYVSVSKHGASTSLAVTDDFRTYERLGVIFPPENKDVLLFPERIDGDYVAIHRPNPSTHFSPPEMWIARSPDLIHWGRHEFFLGSEARWEQGRIGGGAPPLR